ncbi:MAG: LTA synthase family protein, partial [Erysipelotrichaceae bacterium]|nr:LTA synthase family protein [Erysipelotrichaceae bacterium]
SLLIVLFLGAGLFTISREMKRSDIEDDWMGDLYLYDTFYNNLRFYDRFGLYEYVAKDTRLSIEQNQSTSLSKEEREKIDSFISNHQNTEQNDHTGIYSGKNLVLILCESLNDYPLYKDLFPTLNMMAENGTLFTNYYAPLYQSSTSDSEFISLTSMLPSVDFGTTSYSFANNQYPYALPNLFKDAGYNVNSYHSNISNMYNREPLHMSLGFETFYDQEKLGLSTEGRYFQMWVNWIDDDELFDATIRNTHTNKPFFDFVITASGHLPYIRDREEIQIQLDELEKTEYAQLDEETKCYLASQMNFDKGLAQLLDSLKAADQLENTIIILYGDHYPYGLSTEEALNNVVGESDYNKNRVPFIIYDPSTKGSANANLASTFDIYPTICNLFGLDTGDSYQVGRDLFGSRPGIIPFMDRSVLTDTFYYDSTSNSFTEFEGFSKESATEIINDIQDVFDIGQKILNVNYYANEK